MIPLLETRWLCPGILHTSPKIWLHGTADRFLWVVSLFGGQICITTGPELRCLFSESAFQFGLFRTILGLILFSLSIEPTLFLICSRSNSCGFVFFCTGHDASAQEAGPVKFLCGGLRQGLGYGFDHKKIFMTWKWSICALFHITIECSVFLARNYLAFSPGFLIFKLSSRKKISFSFRILR